MAVVGLTCIKPALAQRPMLAPMQTTLSAPRMPSTALNGKQRAFEDPIARSIGRRNSSVIGMLKCWSCAHPRSPSLCLLTTPNITRWIWSCLERREPAACERRSWAALQRHWCLDWTAM